MTAYSNLHKRLVGITADYLGPAAERFINRQIKNHLDKSPEDLTHKDLESLYDWLSLSFSLLTDDEALVKEYLENISQLSSEGTLGSKKLSDPNTAG